MLIVTPDKTYLPGTLFGAVAERVCWRLAKVIRDCLIEHGTAKIPYFGHFELVRKPPKKQYNPSTGAHYDLPERLSVKFVPHPDLLEEKIYYGNSDVPELDYIRVRTRATASDLEPGEELTDPFA